MCHILCGGTANKWITPKQMAQCIHCVCMLLALLSPHLSPKHHHMERLHPRDFDDVAYEKEGKTSTSNQSGWCDSALRGQSQRCRECREVMR